jgi:hypothetical protein
MNHIFLRRGMAVLIAWFPLNLVYITYGLDPAASTPAIPDSVITKSAFYEQNERCFRCHGSSKYTYHNQVSEKEVSAMMCENRIIHRNDFYTANHKSFACVDCHAAEYDTFPHPGQLRMEASYNCIDCHGYDEKYAQYHFEEIEAEFRQSTHFTATGDAFTCWKCHNPHTYRINIRNSTNLQQSIAYDNQICLNCHSDFDRFQLLTDREEINLIQKHEWLPNQSLHFSQVRCIECHARLNDSLMVAHRIMPKDKAVKRCVECHSQNSLLMSSLYKFQAKERRSEGGFLNAIILNDAFVIGANRNVFLNRISLIVFFAAVGLMLIHLAFRMTLKKND